MSRTIHLYTYLCVRGRLYPHLGAHTHTKHGSGGAGRQEEEEEEAGGGGWARPEMPKCFKSGRLIVLK